MHEQGECHGGWGQHIWDGLDGRPPQRSISAGAPERIHSDGAGACEAPRKIKI
jgi:hypothetical protein